MATNGSFQMAEQAQEAVKKALVDCIALYSQGAIQECAAFYAPDGVIMPPGFPPAVGQEGQSLKV